MLFPWKSVSLHFLEYFIISLRKTDLAIKPEFYFWRPTPFLWHGLHHWSHEHFSFSESMSLHWWFQWSLLLYCSWYILFMNRVSSNLQGHRNYRFRLRNSSQLLKKCYCSFKSYTSMWSDGLHYETLYTIVCLDVVPVPQWINTD